MSEFQFRGRVTPALTLYAAIGALCIGGLFGAGALVNEARATATRTADQHVTIRRASQARTGSEGGTDAALFQTGATPQLAQAAVQTQVQQLADAHNVDVEVMQADQIAQVDGLVRLNLSLTAVAPEDQLALFLEALVMARPLLLVSDLKLRRTRAARGGEARNIAVQMAISGIQSQ